MILRTLNYIVKTSLNLMSAESTRTEFIDLIVGHWTNKKQAFANPAKYAYTNMKWELVDGKLNCRSWYNHNGEDNPYKIETGITVSGGREKELVVLNGRCEFLFFKIDGGWKGAKHGDCIVRGEQLESMVELDKDSYKCYDCGRNDKGEIVWGGTLLYHFTK